MLRKDIKEFIASIPKDVTVVAATKYINADGIKELYNNGFYNYGENRVQDFLIKYNLLLDYKDIKWHFIGHLQTNKAKLVLDKIDYLHSLDSLKLAELIDKYRTTPLKTFIEVSINLEETKNGVPYYEVEEFVKEVLKHPKIELVGLMMMAVKDSLNPEEQFKKLATLRDELENKLKIKIPYLSMGMSDDYLSALKAGATHIRLGRILFKE